MQFIHLVLSLPFTVALSTRGRRGPNPIQLTLHSCSIRKPWTAVGSKLKAALRVGSPRTGNALSKGPGDNLMIGQVGNSSHFPLLG